LDAKARATLSADDAAAVSKINRGGYWQRVKLFEQSSLVIHNGGNMDSSQNNEWINSQ